MGRRARRLTLAFLVCNACTACTGNGQNGVDASPSHDGGVDAAVIDARPIDARPIDARPVDAAPVDAPIDAPTDAAIQDPTDPVEEVPAHTGAYTFARLGTVDEFTQFVGSWFTSNTMQFKVTGIRARYARHRDAMVLQDGFNPRFVIYDQATSTVGPDVPLPADAVGTATIRGGFVYVGGSGKVYSYEIATQTWRSRTLVGAGACTRVAAGRTRLFAMCVNPTQPGTAFLYSTWANRTMSDPSLIGSLAPSPTPWITVAPDGDVAYFSSSSPDAGCVGRATPAALQSCRFSLRTLAGQPTAVVRDAQVLEDGMILYVKTEIGVNARLYEVPLPMPQATDLGSVGAYATCPDNSVIFGTHRRAGGLTTDIPASIGTAAVGCPLRKL